MMRILNTAMLLLALVVADAPSQTQHYWIILCNKNSSSAIQKNSGVLGISDRALKRRAKSLPPHQLIDEYDIPVSESALSQIKQTGVKIRTLSRWFNAVSVEATVRQIHMLNALPLVLKTEPVVQFKNSNPLPSSEPQTPLSKGSSVQGINYGPSGTQLTNMKVVDLHAIGVNGTGVLIGMLDDGFNNYRTHAALKNINVIADSDFIHNITDVNRQPWENSSQGNHGAGTLSAVGGFDNGQLIGAAYGASFLLAKTEMDSSGSTADFNSEEDTYVAGLEWAERLGADITSSSLGYKQFLSLPTYTTSDMNGRTTKVARAAAIAARKGVLVVTAMGNDGYLTTKGYADSTLVSPADADSIISVGAADSTGKLATFSSCGPTADGRVKPELVAQGSRIYWANGTTTTGYSRVSGTSCSTPLVAGAAALILSAHPELTNDQVRNALLYTTNHINDGTVQTNFYPNNYYGYGFVNALSAALYWGLIFSNRPLITANDTAYSVSIKIKSTAPLLPDSLFLFYKKASAGVYKRVSLLATSVPDDFVASIQKGEIDSTSVGYFSARDNSGVTRRNPYDGPNETLSLNPAAVVTSVLEQTSNIIPSKYHLTSFPNPFNPSTTLRVDMPHDEEAEVAVFNILGQVVKTLFVGVLRSGSQQFRWEGINEQGAPVSSGIYIARLRTKSMLVSTKLLLLK
jgi:subtilisin family serine protease